MKRTVKFILLCLAAVICAAACFFGVYKALQGSVNRVGIHSEAESEEESSSAEATQAVHSELVPFPTEMLTGENGEVLFDADLNELIRSFNSVYMQKNGKALLSEKEKWVRFADTTPYYGYPAICRRFSPQPENISEPTLSVFMPENGRGIYEIKLTYDEHGNQLAMYERYKLMCNALLSALLPSLSEEEIGELYEKLYDRAMSNFKGGTEFSPNGEDERACIVYSCGGFGFYGCYGGGTANICCVACR